MMRVNDTYCVIKKFVKTPDMPALMLWGPPGIGKSGIVKQVAGDLGIGFIDLRLILLSPIDLKGMPALDRAGTYALNSSLANRFVHLSLACELPPMEMPCQDIRADVEDWKIWAYKNDIHHYIISFLNFRPNLLWQTTSQVAYATPRSWEMVHKIIIAYKGKVKEAYHCISGAVGSGPAAEFADLWK